MKLLNWKTGVGALLTAGVSLMTLSSIGPAQASALQADGYQPHVTAVSTHSVNIAWHDAVGEEVLIYNPSTNMKVVHTARSIAHHANWAVDFGTAQQGQLLAYKVDFKMANGVWTGWSNPKDFFVPLSGGSVGPQGPKGDTGPAGKDGSNGVSLSEVKNLVTASTTVTTGGSFTAAEQNMGSVSDLPAGTYLFTVNAKVAWKSGNGVFPEFFAYNGTPASDFSNNIANTGGCTLPDGNTSMDVYCSGTFQVQLAAGESPTIYAFGYDTDRGAGSYTLESLSVTATELLAA